MCQAGRGQGRGAVLSDCFGEAVVDVCGGVQPDPGVVVLVVVRGHEVVHERAGVGQAAEPFGKGR